MANELKNMLSLIICLRGNPASDCAFCSHSNSQLYDAGWWLCAQSNALIVAEKEKRERDSNVDGSGCLEFFSRNPIDANKIYVY